MNFCWGINFDCCVDIFLVNEVGVLIYLVLEVVWEEFLELDFIVWGVVFIGCCLMDLLVELVKIDFKSIGVGQYQYDVNQIMFKDSFDWMVESSVNVVGINLNMVSKYLFNYVLGLGLVLV